MTVFIACSEISFRCFVGQRTNGASGLMFCTVIEPSKAPDKRLVPYGPYSRWQPNVVNWLRRRKVRLKRRT
jgi:hypothetical protein